MRKLQGGVGLFPRFTPNDAYGFEAEGFAGGGSCNNVVRPGTTEGEQGSLMLFSGKLKIVLELAPFIAADIFIGQIFSFDVQANACSIEQA